MYSINQIKRRLARRCINCGSKKLLIGTVHCTSCCEARIKLIRYFENTTDEEIIAEINEFSENTRTEVSDEKSDNNTNDDGGNGDGAI